jgi:hypothetical protein
MLLAMCFDTSMLISLLLSMMLAGVVCSALLVLAVMGIINLADARRRRLTTLSLSAADER